MKKTSILIALSLTIVFTGCGQEQHSSEKIAPQSLVDVVQQGKSGLFSIPFDSYRADTKGLPVGVFDSGIGGLTVLAEILQLDRFDNRTHEPGPDGIPDFENERFIYLGDQANMPYGNYPSEDKVDFLRELILKDAIFLLGQRYWLSGSANAPRTDKPPVKAIVIACNTATAYGLEDIRSALEQWNLRVYLVGVVEAGARGAVQALGARDSSGAVAVMATVGTCRSEGYVRAVEKSSKEAGIDTPDVVQQGSLGLAAAIEGDPSFIAPKETKPRADYKGPAADNRNAVIDSALLDIYGFDMSGIIGDRNDPETWQLNSVGNYVRYDTTSLVENYRRNGSGEPITAVILGCTHFPYRVESIKASFDRLRHYSSDDGTQPYKNLIAEDISFIDPAQLTAEQLYLALAESHLLLGPGENTAISVDEFFISVPNVSFGDTRLAEAGGFTYDYKYGRNPGRFDVEYVKRVPMSSKNLSAEVINSIRETMPVIMERLVLFNSESPRCSGLQKSEKIMK